MIRSTQYFLHKTHFCPLTEPGYFSRFADEATVWTTEESWIEFRLGRIKEYSRKWFRAFSVLMYQACDRPFCAR